MEHFNRLYKKASEMCGKKEFDDLHEFYVDLNGQRLCWPKILQKVDDCDLNGLKSPIEFYE